MKLDNFLRARALDLLLPLVLDLLSGPLGDLIDSFDEALAGFRASADTTEQTLDDRTVDVLEDIVSLLRSLCSRVRDLEVA